MDDDPTKVQGNKFTESVGMISVHRLYSFIIMTLRSKSSELALRVRRGVGNEQREN